jgi:hypothetical protein
MENRVRTRILNQRSNRAQARAVLAREFPLDSFDVWRGFLPLSVKAPPRVPGGYKHPRRLHQSFRLARGLRLRRSAWPAARTARGLLAVYRARQPLACGGGWGELPGGTRARCGEAPGGGLAGKVALFFLYS